MLKRNQWTVPVLIAIVVGGMVAVMIPTIAQSDDPNAPLPDPHENMQDFSWFIGEWDVQSRILMDPETDEWLEESLHTVHTYELNGHIIFEHFFGPVGGAPIEAWSIRKYNSSTDRWQQKWFDTSTPFTLNWGGTFNEDGEYIGYNEFFLDENFELKGDNGSREIFYNIEEDSFSWRFESTSDGGETWNTTWTLEYTRRQ